MNKGRFNKPKTDNSTIKGSSVEVRNDDVNGALRRLKKILERDNRQKELSKREFYEKSSTKNKRAKEQAKKRHKKEVKKRIASGSYKPYKKTGTKMMKSKRSMRKAMQD